MFNCDVCEKSFTTKYSLTVHKKAHKDKEEGIVLTCDECGKKYHVNRSFDAHKKMHQLKKDGINFLVLNAINHSIRQTLSFFTRREFMQLIHSSAQNVTWVI